MNVNIRPREIAWNYIEVTCIVLITDFEKSPYSDKVFISENIAYMYSKYNVAKAILYTTRAVIVYKINAIIKPTIVEKSQHRYNFKKVDWKQFKINVDRLETYHQCWMAMISQVYWRGFETQGCKWYYKKTSVKDILISFEPTSITIYADGQNVFRKLYLKVQRTGILISVGVHKWNVAGIWTYDKFVCVTKSPASVLNIKYVWQDVNIVSYLPRINA